MKVSRGSTAAFSAHYAARLSGDAVLLYFFLAAVSDKQGLSFYSDTTLAVTFADAGRGRGRTRARN